MDNPENTAKIQNRTHKGRFVKGQSGNPQGKPKGARHKATQAALQLMEGQLEQITQGLVNAALDGDMTAAKLILDKLIPPCKEKALPPLQMPSTDTAQDLPKLTGAILEAVASGELLPSQAAALSSLVANHGKALEIAELEARLTALEAAHEST